MNVLLTGCAGFIAHRVAALLTKEGHSVVGIDNLDPAYDVRLKEWRLQQVGRLPGMKVERLDVLDAAGLAQVWKDHGPFDAVINLAAKAGVRQSVLDPESYFRVNVLGTLRLLEMARSNGTRKFVLASTSSVYGNGALPCRESQPTDQPLSPYAASKKSAETLCFSYHHLYGLHVTVLRYFTVFGPAGRPDMSLFRFIKWVAEGEPLQLYGDGSQSRDFTYVDDIAAGTVAACKLEGYQTINLGSDRPTPLNDVIRQIERVLGRKANVTQHPFPATDIRATHAAIDEARALLGWVPHTNLRDGIEATAKWYLDNRSWAKDLTL